MGETIVKLFIVDSLRLINSCEQADSCEKIDPRWFDAPLGPFEVLSQSLLINKGLELNLDCCSL